jgi:two-component system, response regulator YesN
MTAARRILIIEDEKPLREAFTYLLRSEGFEVDAAENGKTGLAKLDSFRPHLILLDMLMPVMDGNTFLQKAALTTRHPKIKTLMLSNLSDPVAMEDAQVYGVTGSVLKAELSPTELAAMAKSILSGGK